MRASRRSAPTSRSSRKDRRRSGGDRRPPGDPRLRSSPGRSPRDEVPWGPSGAPPIRKARPLTNAAGDLGECFRYVPRVRRFSAARDTTASSTCDPRWAIPTATRASTTRGTVTPARASAAPRPAEGALGTAAQHHVPLKAQLKTLLHGSDGPERLRRRRRPPRPRPPSSFPTGSARARSRSSGRLPR
jgi:hypothetical protein